MLDLAIFIESQRSELKAFVLRLQKAILRVLKAEHEEREEEGRVKRVQARALHGKDAHKIPDPPSFPFPSSVKSSNSPKLRLLRR